MSNHRAGDEFALGTVPDGLTTAPHRIAITLLAVNISLPALILGGKLGVGLGFRGATIACLWGGLVLACLSGLCAYAGAQSRLTTYMLVLRAFGRSGGRLVNLLLSLAAVGWFGIVVMLFVETTARMLGGVPFVWAMLGMAGMAITTIVGFRALHMLSYILLPAKLGLLIWAIWAAWQGDGGSAGIASASGGLEARTAISVVIGGWIVGAVVTPDFARFSRSAYGGAIACAVAIGVGYPAVLVAAAIPATLTGEADLLVMMARLGIGGAGLAIVLLASWTNGASNLYSGSLMLVTVFQRARRSVIIWSAGLTGTTLGLLGLSQILVPALNLLSLLVPPVAGVYLTRFLLDGRAGSSLPDAAWRWEAIAALVLGAAAGGAAQFLWHGFTGMPALDSLLAGAVCYLLLDRIRERNVRGRGLTRLSTAGRR